MLSTLSLLIGITVVPAAAHARCESQVKRADTARGDDLAAAFSDLAKCDPKIAEEQFTSFMTHATEADTLVKLSLTAVDWEVWNPVWQMLGRISDYDARDEVAREIGSVCVDRPRVVPFLQGAYFGLRDIDFQQWDDAYLACESDELMAWMTQQVENPPDKMFDEKFNALLGIYGQKLGAEALPHMSKAAIKAAENGPYDAILMQMDSAVAGTLGDDPTPENKAALEKAMVAVAQGVGPEKARAVADRLANVGAEDAAASLLPVIYGDRVQAGGSFLYGAASIELADCKGEKTAVIHVAEVTEPGRRWVILGDVQEPIRNVKPKLGKCTAEGGDWPVATSPEPVPSSKEVTEWAEGLAAKWTEKGYVATVKSEKAISLQ